jgi:ribosomal protein S18 acetylase RimI-like enzyme
MALAETGPAEPAEPAVIRPATERDAAALADVFIEAWRQAYTTVVSPEVLAALDREQVTRWLAGLIASHAEGTTEVAATGGQVTGFVRYGPEEHDPEEHAPAHAGHGHVFGLYVHPARSGRGIGTALLRHAETRLAARGCTQVSLYVFEANRRARRMYAAAGYRPDGERRVEPEYGAPEIRLVKVVAR